MRLHPGFSLFRLNPNYALQRFPVSNHFRFHPHPNGMRLKPEGLSSIKISAIPQGAADIMYNRYEKDIWKLLQMILNSHIMIGEKFA